MEKIQQALEKARRIRADALQQPRSDGGAGGRQPNAGGNGSASSSSYHPTATATGELRIDYERTRVVDTAPEVLRRNRIVAATREDSGAFEAFRILRTQVLARLEARNGNAIAICGAGQGEGKTLVAVNLAVSVARQPHRSALLVDLDLRNPSVHRCFDLTPEYGLSDYLAGRVPLEECLVNPGIERLVLLPQRERLPQSSELLGLRRMAALAQELKARYRDRIIVYDCPPLLVTDDPLVTMDYADGCLLVVREGKTQRAELLRAAELVGEDRFLGTVLNDARWATASGYYYYSYGY